MINTIIFLILLFSAYLLAKNRRLKKDIEIISLDLQQAKNFSESLVTDLKETMDKLSIEKQKSRAIENRLIAENKGFMPRIFHVKWDTKNHAMDGHFVANCAERIQELIRREDAIIKEINEVDITKESCIEQSGWSHDYLRRGR